MHNKYQASAFLPYRKKGEGYEFYLQKRTPDAPHHPDLVGFFGGGIEDGETPYAAALREIQEELQYAPRKLKFFSRYEGAENVLNIFVEEVGGDFEENVVVSEGEYGKFFSEEEVDGRGFTPFISIVIRQLSEALRAGKVV